MENNTKEPLVNLDSLPAIFLLERGIGRLLSGEISELNIAELTELYESIKEIDAAIMMCFMAQPKEVRDVLSNQYGINLDVIEVNAELVPKNK